VHRNACNYQRWLESFRIIARFLLVRLMPPCRRKRLGTRFEWFYGLRQPRFSAVQGLDGKHKGARLTAEEMEYIDVIWKTTRDAYPCRSEHQDPAEANNRKLRSRDAASSVSKEDAAKPAAPARAGIRKEAVAHRKQVGSRDAPVIVERVVTSDGRKGGNTVKVASVRWRRARGLQAWRSVQRRSAF
jgi:hypothetical protein